MLGRLSDGLAKLWPSLFAFQFIVVARPLPGIRQLLQVSELYGGTVRRPIAAPVLPATGFSPPPVVSS
jgi:hypothetical protein